MSKKEEKLSKGTAIAALIINLVLPGVGSLVGGKTVQGVLQLLGSLFGLALTGTIVFSFLGIPVMIVMWVWAVITGALLVSSAE